MNKAMLAALGILTVTGCGPFLPNNFGWTVDTSSVPDAGQVSAVVAHAADDAWAASAFALYGKDAVHTCFAAFRDDLAHGDLDTGAPGKPLTYRASLADFMCNCARGQSAEPCPEL
jgi:hypothetical protein